MPAANATLYFTATNCEAVNDLSGTILRLQGDGDYEAAQLFIEEYGQMDTQLQADLDRLDDAGIPVDITFEQGPAVLEVALSAPDCRGGTMSHQIR